MNEKAENTEKPLPVALDRAVGASAAERPHLLRLLAFAAAAAVMPTAAATPATAAMPTADEGVQPHLVLSTLIPLVAYGCLTLLAGARLWVHRLRRPRPAQGSNSKFWFHLFLLYHS
jgi:hypothetical protein